jgi:hypothetical protein
MGQMTMCTTCMPNYYLCDFFIEIVDNENNLEKIIRTYDNVYIMHVKRYAIKTYSRLKR